MKRIVKILIIFMVPLSAELIFSFRKQINCLSVMFPKCQFNKITGLLCPACGNTRSVLSLIKGDILGSLHNNPAPAIILIILFFLYLEFIFAAFNKNIKLLPRKVFFWYTFLGLIFSFYIMRNFIKCLQPIEYNP